MQADPTNCNVYIGNISPEVEHEELRAIIASYGPLVSMRMYRKEGYGFAEFENHHDAVRAILGACLPLPFLHMLGYVGVGFGASCSEMRSCDARAADFDHA